MCKVFLLHLVLGTIERDIVRTQARLWALWLRGTDADSAFLDVR
jgi:hypothetical protein